MIYGFIGMSLLFVAIGLALTENNTKYLLSGYNTMREEDRKKVDIKAYVPFFRKFHIFLGTTLLLLGSALTYLIGEGAGGVFLSIYPILGYIYFFITGSKYWKGFSTKGSSWFVVILVGIFLFVAGVLGYGLKEDKVMLEPHGLVFQGSYGEILSSSDIQSIELVDQLPQITFKTNGFGLGSVRKGYFRTKEKEVVKLLLNGDQSPLFWSPRRMERKFIIQRGALQMKRLLPNSSRPYQARYKHGSVVQKSYIKKLAEVVDKLSA